LVPKRKTVYFSNAARLMQDTVAVISLHAEDQISIDALTEELRSSVDYPVDQDKVVRNLLHLRRSKLISLDWHTRTVKRDKTLKDYVRNKSFAPETWSTVVNDWRKVNNLLQDRYGKVNPEYQEFLFPKEK
jgi:hypothetical protein